MFGSTYYGGTYFGSAFFGQGVSVVVAGRYNLADLYEALRAKILTGTAATIYGSRVYWMLAPARTQTPYITISLASLSALRTFDQEGYDLIAQVSLWHSLATGPDGAWSGAQAVRENVGKTTLSVTGQNNLMCYFRAERGPDRDNDLWRSDIDLTIASMET
jgi:hypothetical protein